MGFSERYLLPGGVVPAGDWRVKQYLVTVTPTPLDGAVVEAAQALPAVDGYLADFLPEGPVGRP